MNDMKEGERIAMQKKYDIQVLPIDGTKAACICALRGDDVYEHPHGAYLSEREANDNLDAVIEQTNSEDIEGAWERISC